MLSGALSIDWLERLLGLAPEVRAAEFERLATSEPDLHRRLLQLLEAAQSAHPAESALSGATGGG
jgi:hypothetical protein